MSVVHKNNSFQFWNSSTCYEKYIILLLHNLTFNIKPTSQLEGSIVLYRTSTSYIHHSVNYWISSFMNKSLVKLLKTTKNQTNFSLQAAMFFSLHWCFLETRQGWVSFWCKLSPGELNTRVEFSCDEFGNVVSHDSWCKLSLVFANTPVNSAWWIST